MFAPFSLKFYLNCKFSIAIQGLNYQHQLQFSRAFKVLNFYFKTLKLRANPAVKYEQYNLIDVQIIVSTMLRADAGQ